MIHKSEPIQAAFANCSDILYDAASRGEIPQGQFELVEMALWNAYNKLQKKWTTNDYDWGKKPYVEPWVEKDYERGWDKIYEDINKDHPLPEPEDYPMPEPNGGRVTSEPKKPKPKKPKRKRKKSKPRRKLTLILPRRIHWR